MSIDEIKSAIKRIVDELPEDRLVELLELLNEIKQYPGMDISSLYNFKRIIVEEHELLKRLSD